MQSCSVPLAYRTTSNKQLIGHVDLMSFNRWRHHIVRVRAYFKVRLCFRLGIGWYIDVQTAVGSIGTGERKWLCSLGVRSHSVCSHCRIVLLCLHNRVIVKVQCMDAHRHEKRDTCP